MLKFLVIFSILWTFVGFAKQSSKDPLATVYVQWDFGSDRRGSIEIHACSHPLKNEASTGDCMEKDIVDQPLIDFQGRHELHLKQGVSYRICFIAHNILDHPGEWGACKDLWPIDGVVYRFKLDDFEYWSGGLWPEP